MALYLLKGLTEVHNFHLNYYVNTIGNTYWKIINSYSSISQFNELIIKINHPVIKV